MKRKLLIAATSFMIASSVCGKDFNVLTKDFQQIGRASCRERVYISVVAVSLKK